MKIEKTFHWLVDLTVEFFTIDDRTFFRFFSLKTKIIFDPLSVKLHIDQDFLNIIFDEKTDVEISFRSDEFKSFGQIIEFEIEPTDEKYINKRRSMILEKTLNNGEIDFSVNSLTFQFNIEEKIFKQM